ncbi:MAG: TIGR04551 family protein, partial [Polyangiales bacterium]
MFQRRPLAALPLFAVFASSLALGVSSIARADEPAPPNPTAAPKTGEASPSSASATPNAADTEAKPPLIPGEGDPKDPVLEKPADPNAATTQKGVLGTSGATFSEDWWKHTRPIVEIHGFFRTRAELFHNFSLGRVDAEGPDSPRLFPRPLDDSYVDTNGTAHLVLGCSPTGDTEQKAACAQKTNASTNMRLRIDPEIHISDNLRIMTQIDMLDNLVLGSTPEGYTNSPAGNGYASNGRGGYVPLKSFSTTQLPPTAGVNSYTNSIVVKRVWGEFTTPVGQIRFGRMPSAWGLGILANSGDKIDSDYQ